MNRIRAVGRSIFCILLAAFILGAPAARQVFEVRSKVLPRWQMFSGKGLGIYAVHFELVAPSGERRTVLWGEFARDPPPGRVRRAATARKLRDITREATRICRAAGAGSSLFAEARQAVAQGQGWRAVGRERLDLCTPRGRKKYSASKSSRRRGQMPRRRGQMQRRSSTDKGRR